MQANEVEWKDRLQSGDMYRHDARSFFALTFLSPLHASREIAFKLLIAITLLQLLPACNRSNPYLSSNAAAQPSTGTNPALLSGVFNGANAMIPGQQLQAREAELNRRLQMLDENNRQLQTQIAQSQQQVQLANDERNLLRRQLQDVTGQLQESRVAIAQTSNQLQGLSEKYQSEQQSTQFRGGAKLTSNSSLRASTSSLKDVGFPVIQDGDVIRIRIPADQLFQPNTATLSGGAAEILDRVALAVTRNFPRQRIGIEGHTDSGPFYGGSFATAQQLSSAQSTAVVEQLQRRNQMTANQLFSLAHGTNHPIGDNQTPVARAQNRRIEIVIYPDTY